MSGGITYNGIPVANGGRIFDGLKFWVAQRVPMRSTIQDHIKVSDAQQLEYYSAQRLNTYVYRTIAALLYRWKRMPIISWQTMLARTHPAAPYPGSSSPSLSKMGLCSSLIATKLHMRQLRHGMLPQGDQSNIQGPPSRKRRMPCLRAGSWPTTLIRQVMRYTSSLKPWYARLCWCAP